VVGAIIRRVCGVRPRQRGGLARPESPTTRHGGCHSYAPRGSAVASTPPYSTVTEVRLTLVAEAFVGSRMHVDFAVREPAVTATAPGRAALGPRRTPVLVVMTLGTP
jgi:hypothetical protein